MSRNRIDDVGERSGRREELEEVEPSGARRERERETRERRGEGGMNVEARVGLEVDRKKGSRVALLSSRGLKTFRSVRYAVS